MWLPHFTGDGHFSKATDLANQNQVLNLVYWFQFKSELKGVFRLKILHTSHRVSCFPFHLIPAFSCFPASFISISLWLILDFLFLLYDHFSYYLYYPILIFRKCLWSKGTSFFHLPDKQHTLPSRSVKSPPTFFFHIFQISFEGFLRLVGTPWSQIIIFHGMIYGQALQDLGIY